MKPKQMTVLKSESGEIFFVISENTIFKYIFSEKSVNAFPVNIIDIDTVISSRDELMNKKQLILPL